jgi:hypothetical protein
MSYLDFVYQDIIVKHNVDDKQLYISFPEPLKAVQDDNIVIPNEPLFLTNVRISSGAPMYLAIIEGETLMGTQFSVSVNVRKDSDGKEITCWVVNDIAGGKFSFDDFKKGEDEIPLPFDQYLDTGWDHLRSDLSGNGH